MLEDILVPIFICVVLPVSIVFIIYRAATNSENKRAEVLIKAIEANNTIDTDKLAAALKEPEKSERELLNQRLLRGCMLTFVGIVPILYVVFAQCCHWPMIEPYVLVGGGALLAIGIAYLVVYFVTRKQVSDASEKE